MVQFLTNLTSTLQAGIPSAPNPFLEILSLVLFRRRLKLSFLSDDNLVVMNGTNGTMASPGLWQEARNSDGRVYYYNTQTKATQWNKPLELMTPAEVFVLVRLWQEIDG